MTWYSTGTVSIANGSYTVVGTGTDFVGNVQPGEEFRLPNSRFGEEIDAVISDTELRLKRQYLLTTVTDQPYAIAPIQGYPQRAYNALRSALTTINGYLDGPLAGIFPSGSISMPGLRFASDTGVGLRLVSTGVAALVAGGIDILTWSADGVGIIFKEYDTRAELVTDIAAGMSKQDGAVVTAAGLRYRFKATAGNPIADLPGLIPDHEIWVEHFGAVGDNSTVSHTQIQAAVDYAAVNGTVVLNKQGIGARVNMEAGAFRISESILILSSGVRLVGRGMGTTTIQQLDQTKDAIIIADGDPVDGTNDTQVSFSGIEDLSLYIANETHNDTLSGRGLVVLRALFNCHRVEIRGFRTNWDIRGCGEGSRIVDCTSLGTRGPGVSTQATGDAHVYVGAAETSAAGGGAQFGGRYWDNCVGLYMDNFQAKDPTSIKMAHCLKVGSIDGFYVNNSHLGFCAQSAIRIQSQEGLLNIINMFVDGSFIDIVDTTQWGIEIVEPDGYDPANGIETTTNNINFTDMRGNIAAKGYALVDAAKANNIRFDTFNLNTNGTTGPIYGYDIRDGNDIVVTNGNISSCPGGAYVRITSSDGANRVSVSNVHGRDYGGQGAAAAGMLVDRPHSGMIFENLRLLDTGGNPIEIDSVAASPRDYIVSNIVSDGSTDIASASSIPAPEWADMFTVTGTTTINGFDVDGTGRGQRNGRIITLVFADIVTVNATGNISLASPFTSVAGGSLTLRQFEGTWYEIGRSV